MLCPMCAKSIGAQNYPNHCLFAEAKKAEKINLSGGATCAFRSHVYCPFWQELAEQRNQKFRCACKEKDQMRDKRSPIHMAFCGYTICGDKKG
jgi:hypothetical protein